MFPYSLFHCNEELSTKNQEAQTDRMVSMTCLFKGSNGVGAESVEVGIARCG